MSDEVTLSQLIDEGALSLQTGPFGSQLHSYDYQDQGVPVIPTEGIQEGRIDHSVLPKITREKADELRRHRVRADDILFARRGAQATGRTARIRSSEEGFICGTGAIRARVEDREAINPKFLAWYLATPSTVSWIREQAIGATMPNLNKSIIGRIALPSIPASEQEAIAALLGALDDKIELNRRMSATLEEMARALYRSWFVDFDPVHARALGQPPAHMDATTAALFPDSFGPDGLPKGWEWRSLDGIADFLNGAALQKFPPEGGAESLPVIKIAELRSGVTSKSGRAGLQVPEKYKISNGDVLFSWSGSLLQKVWTEGPGALNQHLFKVSSEVVPKWFHYFAVDQHLEEFRQVAASKATTMGHIQRHHLKEAMIAMPTDYAIIAAASELIEPAFDRSIAVNLEIQTLAALRDALLPRLMSGDLCIRDAEKQVEDAL